MEDYGNNEFSKRVHPHIICGCTGRVLDMMQRNKITSRKIKLVILDEADEMLSSGFKEQVYQIFQHFNNNVCTLKFFIWSPSDLYTFADWIDNSLVGDKTNTWVKFSFGFTIDKLPIANVAVLPVPDCACAKISRLSIIGRIANF